MHTLKYFDDVQLMRRPERDQGEWKTFAIKRLGDSRWVSFGWNGCRLGGLGLSELRKVYPMAKVQRFLMDLEECDSQQLNLLQDSSG